MDISNIALKGIIEDVVIKFDNFVMPVDFIGLDYDADGRVTIILGRLVLVTRGQLFDVRKDNHNIWVNSEDATCKVYKDLNTPSHCHYLCMIIMVQEGKYVMEQCDL